MTALGTRRAVVVALLLAGGALLLTAGRPWVTGLLPDVPGSPAVFVSGRAAAPGAVALGFVILAGALVIATAGRGVLPATAAAVSVAGAVATVTALLAVRDAQLAVVSSAAEASGVSDPVVDAVSVTAWPFVAAAAGVLGCLAAAAAVVRAASWTAGRRFQLPTATVPPSPPTSSPPASSPPATRAHEQALEAWDALSRGDDPT